MKRLLSVITIAFLAVPAFAQDDFGGDFGGGGGALSQSDLDSLLGGGGGGRGGRGGRGGVQIPNAATLYNQIKDVLKQAKVPLAKEQEKPLQTLLDTEAKATQTFLDAQFGNRGNQNQNQNQNRGGRGNQQQNNVATRVEPIISKHNTELLTAIKADLTPDQLAIITKGEKDKKCVVMLDVLPQQALQQVGRPTCTTRESTPTQRLNPIRELLSKGKKPLTAEQETKFVALIEARIPLMEPDFRAEGLPDLVRPNTNNNNNQQNTIQQLTNNIVNNLMNQLGVQGGNRGNNNNNNNRGNANANANPAANANANNRGNQPNNFNPQAEIQRRNEEMMLKVIASLKPEQQSVVKRIHYDDIKTRGGVERIRAIMEEEGTPLTAEQTTQIQALFNEQATTLRQVATQLVQQAMQATPPPAAQPQQNNQNNPIQQYQQQMVAQLLPTVSAQRVQVENATLNSVMKVLTPSQVASYKINTTLPPL